AVLQVRATVPHKHSGDRASDSYLGEALTHPSRVGHAGRSRIGRREVIMSVTSMQEARRNRGRRTAAAAGVDLTAFITSWQLSLEAAGKSPKTVRSYTDSVKALQTFLADQGMPTDVEEVDAEHLRAFLLAEERRTSAPSAAVHFRNLRVYFGWLAREGERAN